MEGAFEAEAEAEAEEAEAEKPEVEEAGADAEKPMPKKPANGACSRRACRRRKVRLCPRDGIIAGCKLDEKHGDGSLVWDWYYDISATVAEAGAEAGPDGGPTFADPVARSVSDVARICADRTRYGAGAELAFP